MNKNKPITTTGALEELCGLSRIDSERTKIRLIEQIGKAHKLGLLDEVMDRIMETEERRPANIYATFLRYFGYVRFENRQPDSTTSDAPIVRVDPNHPAIRFMKASCGRTGAADGQPRRLFDPDYPAMAEAARKCATCEDLPPTERKKYQRMVDAYDGVGEFDGQGSENSEKLRQVWRNELPDSPVQAVSPFEGTTNDEPF